MTRLLAFCAVMFATFAAVVHWQLTLPAILLASPLAAAYVVGQFAGGRTRFEQAGRHQVDELARARARHGRRHG